MKSATITITDTPNGTVDVHIEFTPSISKASCSSTAHQIALQIPDLVNKVVGERSGGEVRA